MNKTKKVLAVLSTAALFGTTPAAVVAPFFTAAVAHAAGSATAMTTPNVSPSQTTTQLGTVNISWPKGALDSSDDQQVTFVLPSGFQFGDYNNTPLVYYSYTQNGSQTTYYKDDGTALASAPNVAAWVKSGSGSDTALLKWTIVSPTLMKLEVLKTRPQGLPAGSDLDQALPANGSMSQQGDDWNIFVQLHNITVSGPSAGPINVTLVGPSDTALPTGSVVVGNVATAGRVDIAATDVKSGSDNFTFNLSVSEEVGNSLVGRNIKLKLPSGFKWSSSSKTADHGGSLSVAQVYGQGVSLSIDNDGQTLTISGSTNANPNSLSANGFLVQGLSFYVDDENVAKTGDVTVQVTGSANINVSSLVVGTYGQVGFQVTATSKPTIVAGKKGQTIGDIIIKENVPGSFVKDRTITLTLPEGARWEAPFEDSSNATDNVVGSITATNGLQFGSSDNTKPKYQYTDSDRRTLKINIANDSSANSNTPAEIDLRNLQVAVQPGFSGDLTIQVGGTEGVTGSVTVATVQTPVSIKVDNAPNVVIGSGGQAIGTITLTENVAGGFGKTTVGTKTFNKVHLVLPYGVQFDGTPNVAVTQGDLQIKDVTTGLGSDNKGYLDFYVDAESTVPSTVTISNAKLKLDRTVPEGDIILKVQGDSVSYTAYATNPEDDSSAGPAVPTWHDNNTTSASAVIAHVATPAASGKYIAQFTVGSTTYTVNGQQQTMDVAPYLKNDGRVMLPVRFVANALGVSDDHIIWNGADQSVTIFKGNSVVKMTVGSNTMIVNGVAVQMDVAPELYNDGRVMLPIRWISQALGAEVSWDQNTQTVTITSQQ